MPRCYNKIFNLFDQSVKAAQSEIILISAFVTSEVISKIHENVSVGVKTTVIARFSKSDIIHHSSDLQAARIVIENGGRMLRNPHLHAKLFMFDKSSILFGSANLTRRGMGLANPSNIECISTSDEANQDDIRFVNELIRSSQVVDYALIDELERQLEFVELPEFDENKIDEVSSKFEGLFINDMPFCESPNLLMQNLETLEVKHDFLLLNLKLDELNIAQIANKFSDSRIMNWVRNNIEDEIRFGELSSKLHDAFIDDPKPYRKEVKDLQQNLLNWMSLLLPEEFKIYVPEGFHTQVIRRKIIVKSNKEVGMSAHPKFTGKLITDKEHEIFLSRFGSLTERFVNPILDGLGLYQRGRWHRDPDSPCLYVFRHMSLYENDERRSIFFHIQDSRNENEIEVIFRKIRGFNPFGQNEWHKLGPDRWQPNKDNWKSYLVNNTQSIAEARRLISLAIESYDNYYGDA